jgi:hypothetical protein
MIHNSAAFIDTRLQPGVKARVGGLSLFQLAAPG